MSSDATLSKTPDRLAVRIPCIGCGYDLRGLTAKGDCPECGTAIQRSLNGQLLRFADARWTRQLARGATLLFWGIVASLPMIGWGFRTPAYELAFFLSLWLVPAIVVLTGWWLVTRPDPERRMREPAAYLRRSVLVVACLGFVIGGWHAAFRSQHHADPLEGWSDLAGTMHLVLAAVFVGAYARRLAPRLARPDLARQTRLVQVLLLAAVPGLGLVSLMQWLTAPPPQPGSATMVTTWWVHGLGGVRIPPPLAYAALPFQLVLMGALLWTLVLYRRYAVAIGKEARVASDRAAGHTGQPATHSIPEEPQELV